MQRDNSDNAAGSDPFPNRIVKRDPVAPVTNDRTLAERAYAAIHELILSGEYAPGDRLRIEDLAATLNLSPTPIREALHRLEATGLSEHVPHRGARVTDLTIEDLRDLYDARLALEPLALSKAAEQFTPEVAAMARGHLANQVAAERRGDFSEAWKAHTAFHFTLYEASGSRWLVRLITPLWESSQRYRLRWHPLRQDLHTRDGEHEDILAACISKSADQAAMLVYNHLARTANLVAIQMVGAPLFQLKKL